MRPFKSPLWMVIIIFIFVLLAGLLYFFMFSPSETEAPVITPTPTTTPTSEAMDYMDEDATPTPTAEPTPHPTLAPDLYEEIFQNHNVYGVQNGPSVPTTFTLTTARQIYLIETYHWNNGFGRKPGTISLEDENGKTYGPWPAEGRDGQGGVKNAYWMSYPDTELPAGTYTIIDSEPVTWAKNAQSGNQGLARVYALK